MVHTDRWLEMDLTWFNPSDDWTAQIDLLLHRVAPLLQPVGGQRGIFFNVGWLIDLVTEWTGNPQQTIPTRSRRTAQWAQQTYLQLRDFFARLRKQAASYHLPDLKIGVLFVQWAHVVWPPELKIYDFDSDWYTRHPELYEPAKSFIGMPDLHPANRLHADDYSYAAFPGGLAENTYFPDFFGAQWGHLSEFLNVDALLLRDGFTGPMIYTRSGPYGTTAPADPQQVADFSQSVRDLYQAVKQAAPKKLLIGYSSAISPVADWRVGCVDFEALVADGYLDAWIEQTWGGAWQDWWHQLWKGWTFQTANLLTRGAMIARANEQRQTPCKFYNLIETWDGWEPWDTIHQVPHKLRWAIWAFSHAAVLTPAGIKVPDGSYISWMNNGKMELLSEADIAFLNTHLNAAQESARHLERVYGPALVYNRPMMAWLSQEHPDWNVTEWIDDQGAMLMKWGVPVLSITRTNWLDQLPVSPESLIAQAPGQLESEARQALLKSVGPVLVTGRADILDGEILKRLGLTLDNGLIPAGFHVSSGDTADTPPYDRPYLPAHQSVKSAGAVVHYQTQATPLLTSRDGWIYWQSPDWSEPFNQFVPKYQTGSTFPHYRAAKLLHELAGRTGLSHLENIQRPGPVAFHLWRSAGTIYLLVGNLETGEFGDSRTPRIVNIKLNRRQLQLTGELYTLVRVDVNNHDTLALVESDREWLTGTITLPPEQSAVYQVRTT